MTRKLRLILAGAGILVVALAVFFLLINPIRGDIGEIRANIEDENSKIARAEQELQMAEDTRTDGRRNQARLLELAKMIPSDAELPSLILQIQDLASKSGISWMQISPGVATPVEGLAYSSVTLALSFTGSFYDVGDFIYRAEQMVAGPGRLLAVKSLSLTPESVAGSGGVAPKVTLSIRMTLSAYVMSQGGSSPAAGTPNNTSPSSGGATTTTVTTQ